MKYKVKPFLIDLENKYGVLFDEIMAMSMDELNGVIEGIENVFNGNWLSNSFSGQHMAIVDYNKEMARIKHFDEEIGEEPTIEIYNMLKAYRDKLKEYENEKTNEIGITEYEVLDTMKLNDYETLSDECEIILNENTIKQSDIQEIIDAFQVASGQSYAIKNTEKILLMLEKYNDIEIFKADNSIIKLSNAEELSDYILSIDEYVDLKKVNDLKRFFS